jgi:hypothetical protein
MPDGDKVIFRGTVLFDGLTVGKFGRDVLVALEVIRKPGKNTIIRLARNEFETGGPATQPAERLTDEQVRQKIKEIRAMDKAGRDEEGKMVESLIARARVIYRLHLPGKVVAVSNMKLAEDGVVEVNLEGEKFLAAVRKLLADEAVMEAVVRSREWVSLSNPGPVFDGFLCKELFGVKGPIQVEFAAGGKAIFDYKAELAAAGENWYIKALTDLNIVAPKGSPDAKGVGSVEFKSVEYLKERYWLSEPGPAGQDKKVPSMQLFLTVHPGQKSRTLKSLVICRALDGNGRTLLPKDRFVTLGCPDTNDTGVFSPSVFLFLSATGTLKELTGLATYAADGPTHEVDLGLVEMKPGAKGSGMGFMVDEAEKNGIIRCKFDKLYPVRALKLLDQSGKLVLSLDYDPTIPHFGLMFEISNEKVPVPPGKVKVIVVLADQAKIVAIPFRLTDLKLPEQK